GASGAKIGAFERINGDIDLGHLAAVGKFGADFLADVEHGRFVALTLADDDGAAHGDGVHSLAHGLGGNLVRKFALALAHSVGRSDGRRFHYAQKARRQVAFNVFPKTASLAFRTSLRSHEASKPPPKRYGLRAPRIMPHCAARGQEKTVRSDGLFGKEASLTRD